MFKMSIKEIIEFTRLFGVFLNGQFNSYGHVGTVSSPNHFFPGQA